MRWRAGVICLATIAHAIAAAVEVQVTLSQSMHLGVCVARAGGDCKSKGPCARLICGVSLWWCLRQVCSNEEGCEGTDDDAEFKPRVSLVQVSSSSCTCTHAHLLARVC